MKSLGNFLRYARKRSGLTQEQIAERLNIVTPVLSKWENDKAVPPLDLLCKLCNILNISIEECINAELSNEKRVLPPENFQPEKLGETLKTLRLKNGWSQAEVGKKLFVTSQTVSKWEAGGVSSLEVLGKLAELFGMTPMELLNGLEHVRDLPEKQTVAEQLKKPNRLKIKFTAVILAVIIFLGAIAGLTVGLVLNLKDGGNFTQPVQPLPTDPDPDPKPDPVICDFVSPIKEFYTVDQAGFDELGRARVRCMFFEVAEDTSVYAISDGKIISVTEVNGDRGIFIIQIEHSYGFISEYFCISEELTVGQEVKMGQQIGTTGNLRKLDINTFYIYLYYNGTKVNPFEYITDLPEPIERPPEHIHEWGEWQSNELLHWQECSCGEKSTQSPHTTIDNQCTVCGYEDIIPPVADDSFYGTPLSEINILCAWDENYNGVDFIAKRNEKVFAISNGKITELKPEDNNGDVYTVAVKLNDGYKCIYHNIIISGWIGEGMEIEKGEVIGYVTAETDNGTYFLHFELYDPKGVNVDPMKYIKTET